MNISAKTIAIGISTLVVVGGSIAYYFLTNDSPETLGWMNSSWLYRKSVTVSNSGNTLTNEDVLIEVDTASLVTAGKLQSDCDDLRFVDSDDSTYLKYWVEGGCNTSSTQVWIQIPSLPNGGKTIYMYYANESAINAEEAWSGDFILLADAACPSDWTRNTDFDNKFIYGSSTYGSTGGTTGSHNHGGSLSVMSGAASGSAGGGGSAFSICFNPPSYGHNVTGTIGSADSTPPYISTILCKRDKLTNIDGMIMLSDDSTPSGWSRFSSLDNLLPYGSSSYGTTGGTTSHIHALSSFTCAQSAQDCQDMDDFANPYSRRLAPRTHTHTITVSSNPSKSNLPPYKVLLYVEAPAGSLSLNQQLISMVSVQPPLGWTRVSSLDDIFVMGGSTVNLTTQGNSSHTHSIDLTLDAINAWMTVNASSISAASSTHYHTATSTSSSISLIPPYSTVIYVKRKLFQSVSLGTEEAMNTPPNAPTSLTTEGAIDPVGLTDPTPEFSAIFSDADTADTGNYYQIQVNTTSDFTGTSMWDSTKTAFNPVITNNSRSSDISYAGNTLQLGTIYYWRIKFWDNNDAESSWSSIANFTMNTTPTAPTALLTEGSTNPNGIADTTPEFSAIFNDPDIGDTGVSYQIEVNTASDFLGTSMWDSTLTSMTSTAIGARSPDISYAGTTLSHNGATYYWRIKFADASGLTSPWSAIGSFVMDGGPFAPTELLTDGQTNPVRILSLTPSFSAIYNDPNGDSASAYQIEVNTNNTFTGTVMWNSTKTSTSVTDNTRSSNYTYAGIALNNTNTTYYWRIKFWDAEDYEGEWSATAQFSSLQASFQFEGLNIEGIKIN